MSAPSDYQGPKYTSLLIKNGDVFDADSASFSRRDVTVSDGRVVKVGAGLAPEPGARVIDATGKIVTPGLIDAHVHSYPYVHASGIEVDPLSARSGVTTFVDAGTAGSLVFPGFRKFAVERSHSNLFALLNVSAIGQLTLGVPGIPVGECDDSRLLHFASAVETVERNRDIIVGIKVRMYTGLDSLAPLTTARAIADEVRLPLVVHLTAPPPSPREVLPLLHAGDIITHIFHPAPGAIVTPDGRLHPDYVEARARGVIMDTGSARSHTSLEVIRKALALGFFPDTVSTDMTVGNLAQYTLDLPHTLSKFIALGMSLEAALTAVTSAPARALLPGRNLGRIVEGGPADLAVLAVEEGDFTYADFYGYEIKATQRLVSALTIKDGVVLERGEP